MKKRTIAVLREYYNLADATDNEIIDISTGTYAEAFINLAFELEDFKNSVWESLPKVIQKMRRK